MSDAQVWNAEFFSALGLMHNADPDDIERTFATAARGHLSDQRVADWAGLLPDEDIFMVAHDMRSATPLHGHDFYEFSYVAGGIVVNVVDGERLYMLPDSLCIMNLNTRHSLEVADSDAVVLNLGIRPRLFSSGIFRDFMEEDSVISEFLRGDGARGHLFFSDAGNHALIGEMVALASAYSQAVMRQSYTLAGRVLMLLDRLASTPTYSYFGVDTKTMRIVSFIRDHCEVASIQLIARKFGYSENYCTQYIKAHTGRTATALIADARVTRAEVLLSSSEMSVQAIARAVGYKSVGHFNELFRSYHGMTPGDYRKLSRTAR